MRELILHMSISLDGFIGHGGGDNGDTRHRLNLEMLGQAGTLVIGRRSYEDMVQAWPGTDSPMGRIMNALPKVVFSESLEAVAWNNARLNERPLEEEVLALKAEPGGVIIAIGGGVLAHSLIGAGLVDELRLTVHPIALGSGISFLHGHPEPLAFELVSATVYADGSIGQTLRPA